MTHYLHCGTCHIWKVIEEIIQLMDICVNFWTEQRIESCHKILRSLLHLNLETVGRKSLTLLILAPGEKTWQPVWWGLSLRPVHSGTGSSFMTLSGITRVEKTEEEMSAPMCSACTLQLSGQLTAWTTDPAQQKPHSAIRWVYERPPPAGSCYETYYLRVPRGSREPIVGNRKWQQTLSVFAGVLKKSLQVNIGS